jgi:hypothetical protein
MPCMASPDSANKEEVTSSANPLPVGDPAAIAALGEAERQGDSRLLCQRLSHATLIAAVTLEPPTAEGRVSYVKGVAATERRSRGVEGSLGGGSLNELMSLVARTVDLNARRRPTARCHRADGDHRAGLV